MNKFRIGTTVVCMDEKSPIWGEDYTVASYNVYKVKNKIVRKTITIKEKPELGEMDVKFFDCYLKDKKDKKSKTEKTRPVGDILLDMESLRDELIDSHGLQWGDMIFELYGWLMVHRPDAQEEYLDGGSPVLYYGPKDDK